MKMPILALQLAVVGGLLGLGFLLWPWEYALWWGIGLVLGYMLLWGDEAIGYTWYQESVADQSPSPTPQLITRSFLFLVALLPLSFFVITSTSNQIGWGVVLALSSGLTVELLWWRRWPEEFKARFFASHTLPAQTAAWWPWVWLLTTLGLVILMSI